MRPFFAALSLTTALCFSSILSAETFTNSADWELAICGTTTSDDLNDLTDGVRIAERTFSYPTQARPWGTLSTSSGTILATELLITFPFPFEVLATEAEPLIFTPDLAGDIFEGFCFEYSGSPVITIFNGTDIVDTITADNSATLSTICWLNSDLEDVTRLEVSVSDLDPDFEFERASIRSADFALKDVIVPPADTCKSLLQDLILDLGSIESTGNHCDDELISYALWYLDCATHDSLWIDDNQVASCNFFFYMKKGTKFLSWVSDNAEVTQVLEDIQAVLGCVTENEIMEATIAGGDANDLAWAADYQDCADYYQSIGNYRKATKYRKWAWLCATWSY